MMTRSVGRFGRGVLTTSVALGAWLLVTGMGIANTADGLVKAPGNGASTASTDSGTAGVGPRRGGGRVNPLALTIQQLYSSACTRMRAFVSVTENAEPVTGLTTANFTIRVDGETQPATVEPGEATSSRAVSLVLESGTTLSSEDLSEIRLAATRFIDQMGPNDVVAVWSFGDDTQLLQDFTSDREAALLALDEFEIDGAAAVLFDAVYEAASWSARIGGRRALVVLARGEDAASEHTLTEAIDRAVAAGVPVFVAGFGTADRAVMGELADQTGGLALIGSDSSELSPILARIERLLGAQYVVSWPSDGPDEAEHVAAIRVQPGRGTAEETKTYSVDEAQCGVCPVASFTWSPTVPLEGEAVQLTDTSTGEPTSWMWTFGDGASSTEQNPTYTFISAGTYGVRLETENDFGWNRTPARNVVVVQKKVGFYEFGDARGQHEVTVRRGDTLHFYFRLVDGDGVPVDGYSLAYEPTFGSMGGAASWSFRSPGVVGLRVNTDTLGLTPGSHGTIRFSKGIATLDGEDVDVTREPSSIKLRRAVRDFQDEWDLFAAGSAGVGGMLGVGAGVGEAEASLSAAAASVKGSGGVGLHLKIDTGDYLTLERRGALSLAGKLQIPAIEVGLESGGTLSGPGMGVGIEAAHTYSQAFHYRGNDGPNSDSARMMHAGFFLESASLGGVVPSPVVGVVIKAISASLLGLSGAGQTLRQSVEEEGSGSTLAGSISATLISFKTPGVNGVNSEFGIGDDILKGAISVQNDRLYAPVNGYRNSASLAWAGNTDPFNLSQYVNLSVYDVGPWAGNVKESLTLGSDASTPTGLEIAHTSQQGPVFNIAVYRDEDFTAHDVVHKFTDDAIVAALVDDPDTGLQGLHGGFPGAVFMFGRQRFLDGMEAIFSTARTAAGNDAVAYETAASRTHGRVRTIDVSFNLAALAKIDLGLQLSYAQKRVLENAPQLAVTGDGADWVLVENPQIPRWQQADPLTSVLKNRVLSGIGPLIASAYRNLVGFFKGLLGLKAVIDGQIPVSVTNPVFGRTSATVGFDPSYSGYEATVISGDPSRLETRFASGGKSAGPVRTAVWAYTTTRVVTAEAAVRDGDAALKLAVGDSTLLTLIGDFVDVRLEEVGGGPVDTLVVPSGVQLYLYADQIEQMGGDPARIAETQIFRHDRDTGAWEQIGGQVTPSEEWVEATIDRTGLYAPGLLTAVSADDSDGDGLADSDEDGNGNNILDDGETDPYAFDTDGDGVGDGAELAAGTDPMDSASTPNRAPILGFVGNRTVEVGQTLELQLTAIDPDGDSLGFDAQGLPPSAVWDPDAALLTWTPTVEDLWRVTVTATEEVGETLSDWETFLLIAEKGAPPIGSAGENLLVIPVAVHRPTEEQTSWVSDAVVHNPTDHLAEANLYFLEEQGDNTVARGRRIEVLAGQSMSLQDVVENTFGQSHAAGALLIGSDQQLRVSSRTYENRPSGTVGLLLPHPTLKPTGGDQEVRLIQLERGSRRSTDLTVINATDDNVTVNVDLFKATGAHLGATTYTLQPFGVRLEPDMLGAIADADADVDDAYAVVTSGTPDARYAVVATVVDLDTGDPVAVVPAEAVASPEPLYLPGVVRLAPGDGTIWRTDLEVHNPGLIQAMYKMELLERGQDNSVPQAVTFLLAPDASARYPDVLNDIFGYWGAAALRITPLTGAIMATAIIRSQHADGAYARFVAGVPESEALTAGETARLVQLSHSAANGYSTDIGMVNTTALAITAEVELHDGDGSLLATETYSLSPFEYRQIDATFGTVAAADVSDGYAIVRTSDGQLLAFAVVIDQRSRDSRHVPAFKDGET